MGEHYDEALVEDLAGMIDVKTRTDYQGKWWCEPTDAGRKDARAILDRLVELGWRPSCGAGRPPGRSCLMPAGHSGWHASTDSTWFE